MQTTINRFFITVATSVFLGWSTSFYAQPSSGGSGGTQSNLKPAKYAAADFDGDGLFDVVLSSYERDVIEVWEAIDSNSFSLALSWASTDAGGLAIADFNDDGNLDIVYSSLLNQTVTIAYGSGDFTFAHGTPINIGMNPNVLSSIDQCEDYFPEILIGNTSTTIVKVVESPTINPQVIDINENTTGPICTEGSSPMQ